MPTFHYRAYDLKGEVSEGEIEAATSETASDALWTRGLTAFRLRVAKSALDQKWWQRDLFSGAGARRIELAAFTREFATLTSADIPLDDVLRIVHDQASSPRVRTFVANLLADVLNGATLSDAMTKQPSMFPSDYVSVVRAGEIGGTVGRVFAELAELLERRLEIRTRIQSALIYPFMLVALSFVTLGIIVGALIPSIAPIFTEGGKPVPATIRLFLAVHENWPEIITVLAIVALAVVIASALAVRRPSFRLALDRVTLRVPVIGDFMLRHETARFARTLGTMLTAGVPLVQAATSARNVTGNRHIAVELDRTIEAIQQGVALHRALHETGLPSVARQMIGVGEEAGKLDRMLIRVAIMFEQQTQHRMERFMAALSPILTVAIAIAVGALIMPVMNAILSINELAMR